MNNAEFEVLNKKLSTGLKDEALQFILDELKKEEEMDTSVLINLILSSHVTSLHNCMKALADGNEEIQKQVNHFLGQLVKFMKETNPIKEVKVYPH